MPLPIQNRLRTDTGSFGDGLATDPDIDRAERHVS